MAAVVCEWPLSAAPPLELSASGTVARPGAPPRLLLLLVLVAWLELALALLVAQSVALALAQVLWRS